MSARDRCENIVEKNQKAQLKAEKGIDLSSGDRKTLNLDIDNDKQET